MFTKHSPKVLFLATMLAAGTAWAAPGQPYSDEWLEGRISGAVAYNSAIDSSDVDVDVNGGAVTLSGTVPSEVERDFIERVAKSMDGVTSVKNELKIDEKMRSESTSSLHQKLADATITASVKTKLLANRATHGLSINVDTTGNVVTLTGRVQSDDEKKLAEELAFDTSGVREVHNNLQIDKSATAASKSSDTAAVSDAWISTKARALLTFTNDFPGSDVSLTTQDGRVTLQGYAQTPEQKQRIEHAIQDVAGVKDVNNQLVVRKMPQGA
jgi:osmotically-inducible protein OsmY